MSAFKFTKKFYLTQQSQQEGVDEYYSCFENVKDLVNLFNADVIDTTELLTHVKNTNASATKDNVLQKYIAIALILNANKAKHESLWNKLENDFPMFFNELPVTTEQIQ